MSLIAFLGALETGLVYSLVAIGAFVSFRLLRFPDLSVDGTFALGGAVAGLLLINGVEVHVATLVAGLAGAGAGLVTAWLHVGLGFLPLLSGILVMISLYTINIRIMGGPNLSLISADTIFTSLTANGVAFYIAYPIVIGVVVLIAKLLVDWLLLSEIGAGLRAAGTNKGLAQAHGIRTGRMFLLGLAIANGLTALAGAMFAQTSGNADVAMGVGVVIIGIASLLAGEALLPARRIFFMTLACIVGAVLYRLAVALALEIDFLGLEAYDLNLLTAVLVVFALLLPRMRRRLPLSISRSGQ